jgi:hypothetical protein
MEVFNKIETRRGHIKDNAHLKLRVLILQGKFDDNFLLERCLLVSVLPMFPNWNNAWNTNEKGMLEMRLKVLENFVKEPDAFMERIEDKESGSSKGIGAEKIFESR